MKFNEEKLKHCLQQAVTFTEADETDAEFSLPITNFITEDNAAGS